MARQTFSHTQQLNRHAAADLPEGTVWRIEVDPVETAIDGGVRVSVGFPVLFVTGWVKNPERFAQRVAEVLSEHFTPDTPSPTGAPE